MSKIAIKVENLSKVYRLYNNPKDRLKESLNPFKKKYHKEHYALKEVSFDIRKGESVGIIGKNGSGKSTVLKIITGVLSQTSGNVEVNGKISALLELGAGFNPEYTGIENIYLNGTIMGYKKEEIDEKIDDILEFADIGEFAYQRVKTYSSGMFVRLAFAVAINVDPDILIVDEALAVGDMRFQQKCFRKIEEFRKTKTVIFVSHDMGAITSFCSRVIWINDGEVVEEGSPMEVSKKYQAFMIDSKLSKYQAQDDYQDEVESFEDDIDIIDERLDVLGDQKVQISGIGLFDSSTNEKLSIVQPGKSLKLIIRAKMNSYVDNPIMGFTIKDRLGNIVTQGNNYVLGQGINVARNTKVINGCFEFTLPNLRNGNYSISPAIASGTQEDHVQHSWVHDALIFEVVSKKPYPLEGYLFLDPIKFNVM